MSVDLARERIGLWGGRKPGVGVDFLWRDLRPKGGGRRAYLGLRV